MPVGVSLFKRCLEAIFAFAVLVSAPMRAQAPPWASFDGKEVLLLQLTGKYRIAPTNLALDGSGNIYFNIFGTGIYRFAPGASGATLLLAGRDIRAFDVSNDGIIYYANEDGIFKYQAGAINRNDLIFRTDQVLHGLYHPQLKVTRNGLIYYQDKTISGMSVLVPDNPYNEPYNLNFLHFNLNIKTSINTYIGVQTGTDFLYFYTTDNLYSNYLYRIKPTIRSAHSTFSIERVMGEFPNITMDPINQFPMRLVIDRRGTIYLSKSTVEPLPIIWKALAVNGYKSYLLNGRKHLGISDIVMDDDGRIVILDQNGIYALATRSVDAGTVPLLKTGPPLELTFQVAPSAVLKPPTLSVYPDDPGTSAFRLENFSVSADGTRAKVTARFQPRLVGPHQATLYLSNQDNRVLEGITLLGVCGSVKEAPPDLALVPARPTLAISPGGQARTEVSVFPVGRTALDAGSLVLSAGNVPEGMTVTFSTPADPAVLPATVEVALAWTKPAFAFAPFGRQPKAPAGAAGALAVCGLLATPLRRRRRRLGILLAGLALGLAAWMTGCTSSPSSPGPASYPVTLTATLDGAQSASTTLSVSVPD
jgi:hypothetical protein